MHGSKCFRDAKDKAISPSSPPSLARSALQRQMMASLTRQLSAALLAIAVMLARHNDSLVSPLATTCIAPIVTPRLPSMGSKRRSRMRHPPRMTSPCRLQSCRSFAPRHLSPASLTSTFSTQKLRHVGKQHALGWVSKATSYQTTKLLPKRP